MSVNIARLKALAADAPLAGPWEVSHGRIRSAPQVIHRGSDGFAHMVTQMVNAGPRTAEYIAAAHPQAVLALIEELEALRETVGTLLDPDTMVAVGKVLQELNDDG